VKKKDAATIYKREFDDKEFKVLVLLTAKNYKTFIIIDIKMNSGQQNSERASDEVETVKNLLEALKVLKERGYNRNCQKLCCIIRYGLAIIKRFPKALVQINSSRVSFT
jgi:hypothetical protein